jgi:NADH-quinone oxidoreductase subunit J
MNPIDVYSSYALIGLLVVSGLWTVLTPTLLRSAIGLGITSALLTLVMFQMKSPLAGVFELSVCAGLITVVFVSTISLTSPSRSEGAVERKRARYNAFVPLIGVLALGGFLLWMTGYVLDVDLPRPAAFEPVREVLWNSRQLDLLGQVMIIFVGVFGVVILFKQRRDRSSQAGKQEAP